MDIFKKDKKQKPSEFQKHILKDGEIWYMENFISPTIADFYYNQLLSNIKWNQEEIKMYGKVHPVPRKTAWYGYEGINYNYSGIKCNPKPWTEELMEIKRLIEILQPDQEFNSVLLNLYMDGNNKVGWHADNEPELGLNPTIASVSLGASRRFDLKHN